MVARIYTVAFEGAEARRVDVQVQVTSAGRQFFNIVMAWRIRRWPNRANGSGPLLPLWAWPCPVSALRLIWPRLIYPKEGAHYDLPIALGLMAAIGAIPVDAIEGFVAIGELSLDGTIAAVPGALPAAMLANGENLWPNLP